MTKKDIINRIREKTYLSKKISIEAVNMVFGIIKKKLEENEEVKLSGFGIFEIRNRKSRIGRNPKTGVEVPIKEGKSLKFRMGKVLKKTICDN
jgi:nucleoid DNA-binding protein